jgi:hypothetical protein
MNYSPAEYFTEAAAVNSKAEMAQKRAEIPFIGDNEDMVRFGNLRYALAIRINEAVRATEIPSLEELYDILNKIDEVNDLEDKIPDQHFGYGRDGGADAKYQRYSDDRRLNTSATVIQGMIYHKFHGHKRQPSINNIIDIT